MKKQLHKFRYGDLVIGNKEANNHYMTTRTGTLWVVIDPCVYEDYDAKDDDDKEIGVIRVERFERWKEEHPDEKLAPAHYDFPVAESCFDFVKHLEYISNKEHAPHILERYDD